MSNLTHLNQHPRSGLSGKKEKSRKQRTSYDIHLTISRTEIANILDSCLEQRLRYVDDDTDQLLKIAECIKEDHLSEEFCDHFTAEITDVLRRICSVETDSAEMANFQHDMLRKLSNCDPKKRHN